MKKFLNTYNILFLLVVLSDTLLGLQTLVGIPDKWQLWIKVAGVLLISLINQVRKVNEENLKLYEKAKGLEKGGNTLKLVKYNVLTYIWFNIKELF